MYYAYLAHGKASLVWWNPGKPMWWNKWIEHAMTWRKVSLKTSWCKIGHKTTYVFLNLLSVHLGFWHVPWYFLLTFESRSQEVYSHLNEPILAIWVLQGPPRALFDDGNRHHVGVYFLTSQLFHGITVEVIEVHISKTCACSAISFDTCWRDEY
jgi:hypothetical protein